MFCNFTFDFIDRTHVLCLDPYSKRMCLRYLYILCFQKKITMKISSQRLSTTMALSGTALLLILCSGVGSAQVVSTAIAVKPPHPVVCEDLRLRCAFADGCGVALHNYFLKCDKMLQTEPESCPIPCLYALVALTSTAEGKSMMEVSTSYIFK